MNREISNSKYPFSPSHHHTFVKCQSGGGPRNHYGQEGHNKRPQLPSTSSSSSSCTCPRPKVNNSSHQALSLTQQQNIKTRPITFSVRRNSSKKKEKGSHVLRLQIHTRIWLMRIRFPYLNPKALIFTFLKSHKIGIFGVVFSNQRGFHTL